VLVILGTCNGVVSSVRCGGVNGGTKAGGYEGSDGRGRENHLPAGEAMVRRGWCSLCVFWAKRAFKV